jgi:hypothetical protein
MVLYLHFIYPSIIKIRLVNLRVLVKPNNMSCSESKHRTSSKSVQSKLQAAPLINWIGFSV